MHPPTREAAMAVFARSWRRGMKKNGEPIGLASPAGRSCCHLAIEVSVVVEDDVPFAAFINHCEA
jgi:hypothetical protein